MQSYYGLFHMLQNPARGKRMLAESRHMVGKRMNREVQLVYSFVENVLNPHNAY